jgi:hypothetical protein
LGITIHFKGIVTHINDIDNLVAEVRDICEIMKWPHREINEDWLTADKPEIRKDDGSLSIEDHLGIRGIGFDPHADSESVQLYFDSFGNLTSPFVRAMQLQSGTNGVNENWNWVKTQFAPIHTHVVIIKLLRHLKTKYIHNLEVLDEGGYWDSGDMDQLVSCRNTIFGAMKMLEEGLEKSSMKSGKKISTEEELVNSITRIFEEIFTRRRGI